MRRRKECTWLHRQEDDGPAWKTFCGEWIDVVDGITPSVDIEIPGMVCRNGFHFCPCCGGDLSFRIAGAPAEGGT